MKSKVFLSTGILHRWFLVCLLAGVTVVAGASPSFGQQPPETLQDIYNQYGTGEYGTTIAYVAEFYPLWFTYNQFLADSVGGETNRGLGSDVVTPAYHFVVAINYDTLYSSIYFDLRTEPVVVTFPPTTRVKYSLLVLDPYGKELNTVIPPDTPGAYAFTGPNFSGTLPEGVTRVNMDINFPTLFIRTLKYVNSENRIVEADAYRASVTSQPLSKYIQNPSGGTTQILPEKPAFTVPFKTIADTAIANTPILFLKTLQLAVAAKNTPDLSTDQQTLVTRFNQFFGNGSGGSPQISAGARKAHELILQNYLTHTGSTHWINFRNIGNWGPNIVDRSSITEFFQLTNGIGTAAYYHAFSDGQGNPLNGSHSRVYVVKFTKDQIPQNTRFWSITAYTPDAIELVPNDIDKYLVASYTPGLHYGADGSLEIYLSEQQPQGVMMANWLPIPPGAFNIALRVYGPAGKVADGTYVPPPIQIR